MRIYILCVPLCRFGVIMPSLRYCYVSHVPHSMRACVRQYLLKWSISWTLIMQCKVICLMINRCQIKHFTPRQTKIKKKRKEREKNRPNECRLKKEKYFETSSDSLHQWLQCGVFFDVYNKISFFQACVPLFQLIVIKMGKVTSNQILWLLLLLPPLLLLLLLLAPVIIIGVGVVAAV